MLNVCQQPDIAYLLLLTWQRALNARGVRKTSQAAHKLPRLTSRERGHVAQEEGRHQ